MTYVALARRYRPQSFAEVVAQKHITDTLRQAIAGGRVAPAYLFTGQRGSGKTTVARILAKAVNCDKPKDGEPDGKCDSCVAIAEGRSLDVLEIDGASNNSVDDVRELRENVGYAATAPGKRKVYIVDEVHMLSKGAFNALLKTLEEPPPHVVFVFATTEPDKVPPTILSRCQRFDFRRLQTDEIRSRLQFICKKEKLEVEDEALFLIAKRADGSLRDGLSLLDQVVSSSTQKDAIKVAQVAEILGLVRAEAYLELTEAILNRDAKRGLESAHAVLHQGVDASDYVLGLVEHLRNLLLLGIDPALASSVQLGDVHLKAAREQAGRFKPEDVLWLFNRAATLYEDLRRSPQPVLSLETSIVEMTRFESRVVLAELLERLDDGDGGPAPRDATPGAGAGRTATGRTAPAPSGRRGSARAEADAPPLSIVERETNEPAGAPEVRTGGSIAARRIEPVAPAPRAGESLFAAGGAPTSPTLRPGTLGAAARNSTAAAGTPAAGAATGTAALAQLDLETLCNRWEEFTRALRAQKAILAHCLSEGRPVRYAAGTIDIYFPAEHTFHVHALEAAVRQRELDGYLASFFGAPLKLAVTYDDAGASANTPAPAGPAARLTPDDVARSRRGAIDDVVQQTPGVEAIIEAFDGEVLEDPPNTP
jgi:DNA polymerase-3 subunit gamma/tau